MKASEQLAAMSVEEASEDVSRILNVLEAERRNAVKRERDSVRKGYDKQVVYDQGIADGLRQAIAIIEGGKW